jgi:putative PIN family toxin of toxin-antitoxin system
VRTVLDPNVIISALLSPTGSPARALRAWMQGDFELVVSPQLLQELSRALGYPKLRKRIEPQKASLVDEWLEGATTVVPDPHDPVPLLSPDPGDDYLIALARAERAVLVSGDQHLLGLGGDLPIFGPADFLDLLKR